MRSLLAMVLTVLTLGLGAFVGAAPAAAHAARVSAEPTEDSTLAQGPPVASATFNEEIQKTFAVMTVVGPDGNLWSKGPARVQGANVYVDLLPLGPVGTYTVNYRVTSVDGHVISGNWRFQLTQPGNGTPGPPAEQSDDGALPVWPFVAAAVLIVGAGAWWAVRRRA